MIERYTLAHNFRIVGTLTKLDTDLYKDDANNLYLTDKTVHIITAKGDLI